MVSSRRVGLLKIEIPVEVDSIGVVCGSDFEMQRVNRKYKPVVMKAYTIFG